MSSVREKLIEEIMPQVEAKRRAMLDVFSATRELKEALLTDNRMVIKEVIRKRGQALERAAMCDQMIEQMVTKSDESAKRSFALLLKGDFNGSGILDKSAEPLKEQISTLMLIWNKIIELDKEMSQKIAGKTSFYGG